MPASASALSVTVDECVRLTERDNVDMIVWLLTAVAGPHFD